MPLQTAAKEENAGKNCRIQKGNAFSMNNTINASTPYTMCIQGKHSASVNFLKSQLMSPNSFSPTLSTHPLISTGQVAILPLGL